MKRLLKYVLLAAVVALLGYKSVYFKKLSEAKQQPAGRFDAAGYSKKIWNEQLPPVLDSAVELSSFIQAVNTNPEDAFGRHSHAMGIGNYRYSLVKTRATVNQVNEDDIIISIQHGDSLLKAKLATEYVYGNAIRDASGLIDIRDFTNAMDLNSISEELNKIVRTELLPSFKKQVKQGDQLEITAAIELNKQHIKFNGIELIPVRLKIVP
jgi:predicted lipoprotein